MQGGIVAPNEARAKFNGMPPVEHGDTPIVQQQMVPLGYTPPDPVAAPVPAPAIQPPEEDPEAAKGAIVYQLKKAMKA